MELYFGSEVLAFRTQTDLQKREDLLILVLDHGRKIRRETIGRALTKRTQGVARPVSLLV